MQARWLKFPPCMKVSCSCLNHNILIIFFNTALAITSWTYALSTFDRDMPQMVPMVAWLLCCCLHFQWYWSWWVSQVLKDWRCQCFFHRLMLCCVQRKGTCSKDTTDTTVPAQEVYCNTTVPAQAVYCNTTVPAQAVYCNTTIDASGSLEKIQKTVARPGPTLATGTVWQLVSSRGGGLPPSHQKFLANLITKLCHFLIPGTHFLKYKVLWWSD